MIKDPAEIRLLLQRRLREVGELSEAAAFYGALIDALLDVNVEVELPPLSADDIKTKLARGQPVLAGEALGFDADAIKATLLKLCEVTERFGASDKSQSKRSRWSLFRRDDTQPVTHDAMESRRLAAAQIREALQNGKLDFEVLLEQLVMGNQATLAVLAERARLDATLLSTLARFAVRPTMNAYATAFAEIVVNAGDTWKRPLCPVCGGPPMLSEFREQEQTRDLRCATCGMAWFFPHLACGWCSNDNFRALGYFVVEGDVSHRVDTCDACHGYLKRCMVSELTPSELLPLEDLLTLPLDVAAEQKGYTQKRVNKERVNEEMRNEE
jgi:hypothetical protein